MKVLLITNIPSPYKVQFYNELGKLCDLTVLFELKRATDRHALWKSEDFKYFHAVFMKGKRIGNESAFCPEVLKYITDKQYDIINITMYSTPTSMLAIQVLIWKKKSFIISTDGGLIKDDFFLAKHIKIHFISHAQAWLSTGTLTNQYLCYYGANPQKVYNYPFSSIKKANIGWNINHTMKNNAKKKLNIKATKLVLSIGQFIYRKGFDCLIKSAAQLENDVAVYIIGGKATEEYLEILNKNNIQNVFFFDFMPSECLKDYFMAADLFVLPTREDIWGLVINEAMAYGLPVITTERCGAGLEMIENNVNGSIVPVDDVEGLTKMIIQWLHKEYNPMLSLQVAAKYTIDEMTQVYYHILSDLIV